MGDVRQEHGQLRHVPLAMVNQHEEENEADERRDQDQEAEEQTLGMKWSQIRQSGTTIETNTLRKWESINLD